MNKILKLLISLIVVTLATYLIYIYATEISIKNLTIREETINSSEIPLELDEIKILFFSDLHYNNFMDKERLEVMVDQIKIQNFDIVLFGGDLLDHPASNFPSEEVKNELIDLLKQIEAPLGKFAVLGNHDLESSSTKDIVENILYQADFEVITNQTRRIRNFSNDSIVLVGLDSQSLGSPDFITPFENILEQDFTIVLCHTPDTVLEVPQNLSDLFLAGHGHGGQVDIPFLGSSYKPQYAQQYYKGKHYINNILLDVTSGMGTTKFDVRLFAPAEVVIYTLKSS